MADRAKKISEVPAVTSVVSTDLFVVVANAAGNAVTSRITLGSLANTLGISNTSSANLTYSINKITTSTLSVGNSTINTAISAAVITSNATLAIGNTTVTGFINATSLNISGLTSTGNTTVTGFINVSTYGTFGGTVNATSLNISGLTSTGNTTVTGFINVSTYGTFGGTVNAGSLNISSNTINLNGVTIIRGDASTRLGVNTQIGSTGSNGSIYLSTAGKIYLKVANTGVATDDWQRVTTTAVD